MRPCHHVCPRWGGRGRPPDVGEPGCRLATKDGLSRVASTASLSGSSRPSEVSRRGLIRCDAAHAHSQRGAVIAFDTFIVYVGVYPDVDSAEADYDLVKDLHRQAGLIDAYDAAVIHRADPEGKYVHKPETPTRVGGVLGGGLGLATGLVVALFPFAAIGGGLLRGYDRGRRLLGAVAGHASAGIAGTISKSSVSTWIQVRPVWSSWACRTWPRRSSGRCGTPRRWRRSNCTSTSRTSNVTPRPLPSPTDRRCSAELDHSLQVLLGVPASPGSPLSPPPPPPPPPPPSRLPLPCATVGRLRPRDGTMLETHTFDVEAVYKVLASAFEVYAGKPRVVRRTVLDAFDRRLEAFRATAAAGRRGGS